jgi:hypothetical protein
MSTSLVIHNGAAPPSRFGIRIRKVYGADPRIREHRANMFRIGIPPLNEPGVRGLAKWTLGISLVLMLFALGAASGEDGDGAVLWILLLGAAIAWALYVLMHQSDVDLPAVSLSEFDKMFDHFAKNSEGEALRRLSYDLGEDVFVRQSFGTFDFDTIPEAVSMPHGMALYPHTRAFTVLLANDGFFRFNLNFRHHVFANQRGLAYVCTTWDFIEDGMGPNGYHPPRVVEINQWTWRTIENLRVGEHSFVIQTVGANRVELPYIGRPPGRPAQEPGAYDWYYNTPAAQQQRQARWGPPGSQVGATPPSPVDNPALRRFLDDGIQRGREAAITFVNTVNSLRNEWEDRQ